MTLTNKDLSNIKTIVTGIVSNAIDNLAQIVNKSFERVEKKQTDHTQILADHSQILSEHSQHFEELERSLDRIETRQRAEQTMLDRHDRRIERIEKHRQF